MVFTSFFLFCVALSFIDLGDAAAYHDGEGIPPRNLDCEGNIQGEDEPFQGKCTPIGDCAKYISLPPYPGKESPCSLGIETCCVKQLCNLSGITSSVAKNTKFYCTNVDNHIGDMFPNGKNNWAHVLEKNSDFVTHPAAPYAIGNLGEFRPNVCPGDNYRYSNDLQGKGYMMCWIDHAMTISLQGDGQTSSPQRGSQSAIEGPSTVADNDLLDGNVPEDPENGTTDFGEQPEELVYKSKRLRLHRRKSSDSNE